MKRRISVLALAFILLFTSINMNVIDANANMLSDAVQKAEMNNLDLWETVGDSSILEDVDDAISDNEKVDYATVITVDKKQTDFENETSIDKDVLVDNSAIGMNIISAVVWQKLLMIAEKYADFEYDEYVAKVADNQGYFVIKAIEDGTDDKVSFLVENNKEKLELILTKNEENCEIIYSLKDSEVVLFAKQLIVDTNDVISFEISNDDEIIVDECTKSAEELLQTAILEWNIILNDNNISWSDLGFENWTKCCEFINLELEDSDESTEDLLFTVDNEEITAEMESTEEILDEQESLFEEVSEDANSDDESEEEILEEIAEEVSEEFLESCPAYIPAVERIATNYDEIVMKVGEKIHLKGNIYPENTGEIIAWSIGVDDSSVDAHCAEVDGSTGVLTAFKENAAGIHVEVTAGSYIKKIPLTIISNDVEYDVDENGNPSTKTNIYGGKEVIAEGIWVGGFEKSKTYTGKPVTQEFSVYCKGEKLTIKKDYNLSYKNNINACSSDVLNAPSVTITMAGKYSGKRTLYYEIKKAKLKDSAVIETENTALVYNGKIQKYVPVVSFNGKKLANNKDFNIIYSDSEKMRGEKDQVVKIDYIIVGSGNFSADEEDALTGSFYITPKQCNLSTATVSLNKSVKYNGNPISVGDLNLRIKLPGTSEYVNPLDDTSSYDVEIIPADATSGTAKVKIEGTSENVVGRITKTFKIVPAYNLATVAEVNEQFEETLKFYSNTEFNKQKYDESLLKLKDSSKMLTIDEDYVVTYSNISKIGTAKVTFKGIGAYFGSISKTYKLEKNSFDLVVNPEKLSDITFVQGNNKQSFKVYNNVIDPFGNSYQDLLTENVDYTVKYTNNMNAGSDENKAKVVISFKGAYAGAEPITKEYIINKRDISECSVTVPDKAYIPKAEAYKSVPLVVAPNGKKLVVGKDYENTFDYKYENCDENNEPEAGTKVTVVITGKGNYTGTVTGTYTVYDSKTKGLNKLYFEINDQVYTGKIIEPKLGTDIKIYTNSADFKAKTNAVEDPEKYVRIISYKNNISTGTGAVVLGASYEPGNYAYGGIRNVSFKIVKRKYDYNAVVSVSLDKNNVDFVSIYSKDTTIVKAYFESTNITQPDKVDNPTLVWKSSNPDIVEIVPNGIECKLIASGNGSAYISCTTQDGNKVAKCAVNSIMKPIETVSGGEKLLELSPGESYQLFIDYLPVDAYVEGGKAVYTSTNDNVAKVDENGEITAVSHGMATVFGTINDKSLACIVNVENSEDISYINITSYGAKPDDDKDDTKAFYKAIEALKKRDVGQSNLLIPPGNYNVDTVDYGQYSDHAINLEYLTDAYINMEGAVITHKKDLCPKNMRGIFTIDKAKNVIIEGGTIVCNSETRKVNENYYGIMIVRSSDIQIKGVTILDSRGDGIYVGKDNINNINNGIYIKDCTISGSRRNNISLVNSINVVIDNCTLTDAIPYWLINCIVGGMGIDIEPNRTGNQYVKNVYIKDCSFSENREDFGIHCHRSAGCKFTSDIILEHCTFDKMIAMQCGKNIVFKNTAKEPKKFLVEYRKNVTIIED